MFDLFCPDSSLEIIAFIFLYYHQGPDLYAYIEFIGFTGPDDDDLN